jgi:Trypsin
MLVATVEEHCLKLSGLLAIGLAFVCFNAQAIIMRHDVPDDKYKVAASEFPALADLPVEGHGVLIAPGWVVTLASAVANKDIHEITINGKPRAVARIVLHPGYKPTPREYYSGDATRLLLFERDLDDIAMIELKEPITDVQPALLYRGENERNEVVEILGKGATGNGLIGQYSMSSHRGDLRRAFTRVESADGHWIKLRFETKREAQPLEGMPGNGDEGGPVFLKVRGLLTVVGLMWRLYAAGDLANYRYFVYEDETYEVRMSHYAPWIDQVMAGETGN